MILPLSAPRYRMSVTQCDDDNQHGTDRDERQRIEHVRVITDSSFMTLYPMDDELSGLVSFTSF